MDGAGKKNHPECGSPDPKGQRLHILFYMWMLAFNMCDSIQIKRKAENPGSD